MAEPVGSSERISERFSGQGGRGPYTLTWRGFTPRSERVTLNGIRLYRQQDYWVDYAAGTLALGGTVHPNDDIVVEYRRGDAQSNAGSALAPAVRLFDSGATRLLASYNFSGAGSGPGSALRISSVGLGAESAGKNWKMNSSLLLATQGGNFSERSGMRFGGQYGFGALQLTGDYSRVGSSLELNGANGLEKARQSTSLGLLFNPSNKFRFSTQYKTVSNKDNKGKDVTLTAHELALKPNERASLLASRRTEETTADGKTASRQTDTLALELKPSIGSTLLAKRTTEESGTGEKDSKPVTVRTDTLRLEQKLSGNTSALAELQSVSSGEADTSTARVGLSTKLTQGIALETTAYQKQTSPGGDVEKQAESGLQAKLVTSSGPLQVQTRLEQKQLDEQNQSTAGLEIATKGGTVKVQGELGKNSTGESDKNRYNARLEVNPIKPVKIVAGLSQSEESQKGGEEPSDPVKGAEKQVGVEINPNAALSVGAQFQTSSAVAGESNVTSLTTRLKPLSFLQLSGTLKQREAPTEGLSNADTRVAMMDLQPVKGWKLTGGYTQNPEENGQLFMAIRRRMGLETTLGSLLLNGGYEYDDRSSGNGIRTTELGFGLNFSTHTQLRAMYKISDGFGEGFGDTAAYGIKFSRNMGDTFNLSLEGEASETRIDPTAQREKLYKGSAKLGVKF